MYYMYILYPPFHLPENIPPLASRVWTTLQLERLLVRSSTVLDKFSVSSRSPMQNTRHILVGSGYKKKRWTVSGMYGIVKLYSTIYTCIFCILVCTRDVYIYIYCNHLIYAYAYHAIIYTFMYEYIHISKCWWWRLRSYWFSALLLRWSFCYCFSVTWPWTWVCFFVNLLLLLKHRQLRDLKKLMLVAQNIKIIKNKKHPVRSVSDRSLFWVHAAIPI